MSKFKDNWTKFRQNAFDFLQAVEGVSSYQFDRLEQLQGELAVVKAEQSSSCEACACRESVRRGS